MDLIQDVEDLQFGMFEKRLPCFGCGIDWFSFVFPLMWYYATILYFGNYDQRDPRERAGLAASEIATNLVCTIAVFIALGVMVFHFTLVDLIPMLLLIGCF
ncbi:hypothetical protein UlMin_010313 [Ulmus minor]